MRVTWILTVCGLLLAGWAWAQEQKAADAAKPKPITAVIQGEGVCLGCALKKEAGAAAECDKHGHRHALRVSAAIEDRGADGEKALPELKGWVLHYLDTDRAQPFIKGEQKGQISLQGKVYPAERVLEVLSAGKTAEKPEKAKKPEHPDHPKKPEHPEHPEHPKKP